MRATLVLIHRYVGLVMAGFLLVAGLTGSLLAWNDELEAIVAPAMFVATPPTPGAPLMDPLELREQVERLYPQAQAGFVRLDIEPGRNVVFYLSSRPGSRAALPNDQVALDPYTGEVAGERKYGDLSQGLKNLMPFVYRLHYSLALGEWGSYAFGIVALLWTLDCFVGAYLTVPVAPKKGKRPAGKPWLTRWWPAWKLRTASGAYKLNFDLHRAGGLWPWAMLLVLAWSSVAFNLREVYNPLMTRVLAHQIDDDAVPALAQPRETPRLSWQAARGAGRQLMAAQARAHGFRVDHEDMMAYDASRGLYRYDVHSSRDIRDHRGSTTVYVDGDTGALKGVWLPTGAASGDTLRMWITSLHMAALWGWPFKVFITLMGMAVATLSVTGVVIWLKKRHARLAMAQAKARARSPRAGLVNAPPGSSGKTPSAG